MSQFWLHSPSIQISKCVLNAFRVVALHVHSRKVLFVAGNHTRTVCVSNILPGYHSCQHIFLCVSILSAVHMQIFKSHTVCCIPRWWWVGIVEYRLRRKSLSALEYLRIKIQAPSNSRWCVIIADLLVEEVMAIVVLNGVLKCTDSW